MRRAPLGGSELELSAMLWYCLLAIIVLAGLVLYWRGFDIWTVILICLALVCPAVVVWGLFSMAGERLGRVWRAIRNRRQDSR